MEIQFRRPPPLKWHDLSNIPTHSLIVKYRSIAPAIPSKDPARTVHKGQSLSWCRLPIVLLNETRINL